jgi:peptidoglycan/LPS O-acetylase OafA/YrhL
MLGAWAQSLPPAVCALVRGGYLAVNVFFILSGFVLARGYSRTPWDRRQLARYGMRRFARIYPVYALSIVLMIPFILSDRLPWMGASFGSSKAGIVADYVLLLQGWVGKLPVNWNTPAWSLSCELFFYACFPLVTLLLTRHRLRDAAILIFAACAVAFSATHLHVPAALKPLTHLSDFLAGMAAASVFDIIRGGSAQGRHGRWLYIPAITASVALISWPGLLNGLVGIDATLRLLGATMVIGLGIGGGLLARLLSSRIAVHLGHASYALYILHIPVLWWYKRWFGWLFGPATAGFMALIYVAAAVILASLVFRFIEEPANRRLRNFYTGQCA